jgi:hypothetical protein
MSETLEAIKNLIDKSSIDERKEIKAYLRTLLPHPLEIAWGVDADTILSAILRSSDLTKRGVRGIIAEAVFENEEDNILGKSGWRAIQISGDLSYDALLQKDDLSARIQIKLQRLEKGVPKLYYPKHYESGSLYVVEVQKTRSGEQKVKKALLGTSATIEATASVTVKTRPYRFGDFDILAVNMHPSSGSWKNFRYTLGDWLLPRPKDKTLIEIFQPVAATPNDLWTEDLLTCLRWFEEGRKGRVLKELLHYPFLRENDQP